MKLQISGGMFLAGLLAAAAVMAEPVAMVTDVEGTVSVFEHGKTGKVELLSYLEPGTMLQLDAHAHLTATFFAKPVEYRFSGPAKLKVEQEKITADGGRVETQIVSLQKTSAARKFTVAQRESLTQAAFEMRGGHSGLRLDDPVDTSLLYGDSLVFGWNGPRPKGGYRLSIYGGHERLLHQQVVDANSWVVPAGLLRAGKAYEWEVKAVLDNGEILTARGSFSVAKAADAENIRMQAPHAGAPFSERVLYAVFLEQQGYGYDARRLWRELSQERPGDVVAKEHSIR